MRVSCPHCQAEFTTDDSAIGKKARCLNCRQMFTVEDPAVTLSAVDDDDQAYPIADGDSYTPDGSTGGTATDDTAASAGNAPHRDPVYDLPRQRELQAAYAGEFVYAGFWRRFAAAIIDSIICGVAGAILGGILGGMLGIARAGTGSIEAGSFFAGTIINWLYHCLFESSKYQATPGKMALQIMVTDMQGNRVSFARATGRHFAKYLSMLTLYIGFIMAGFTDRKQALHDMVASCLVVRSGD